MPEKDFILAIEARLAEDSHSFAAQFGKPAIAPWIQQQYDKGFHSFADFKKIVSWIDAEKPAISNYDFHTALKQASTFEQNLPAATFSGDQKIESNDIEMELENGSKWARVHAEDCNSICHMMHADLSELLEPVIHGQSQAWVLLDPQDNPRGLFVHTSAGTSTCVGPLGKLPVGIHDEIKKLCVRKGLSPIPEAYSDNELADAVLSGEIDVTAIKDLRSFISRLSNKEILACKLVKYSYYLPLARIFQMWSSTGHDCLLQYAFCAMIVYGMTHNSIYDQIKDAINASPLAPELAKLNSSTDTRPFAEKMDEAVEQINKIS